MGRPTCSPYLIGVGPLPSWLAGVWAVAIPMRLVRLPGIHHDSACVVVSGTESTCIIDPGTNWHQVNLIERLKTHLEGRSSVDLILLTHRHYDSCGAAPHLAEVFDADIRIHEDAVAALAGADMFTTWASRYGSDMPEIEATGFAEGDLIELGDVQLRVLHTPGHTMDACCFLIQMRGVVICGDLVPASGHPVRADMPTGNLLDLKESLERLFELAPTMLVCGRGEAIEGSEACAAVLEMHIDSVTARIEAEGSLPEGWPKPAETCHWLTPEPAWSFE